VLGGVSCHTGITPDGRWYGGDRGGYRKTQDGKTRVYIFNRGQMEPVSDSTSHAQPAKIDLKHAALIWESSLRTKSEMANKTDPRDGLQPRVIRPKRGRRLTRPMVQEGRRG
jgi:hypothetical protein